MGDIFMNAVVLGQTLNSLPSLETVIVSLEVSDVARRAMPLAPVVLACHNAKRFLFRLQAEEHPENVEVFSTFIQGHPNLEHVEISEYEDLPESIRNILLGSLASLTKLKSVELAIPLRTLNDTEGFRSMLQVQTLATATLDDCTLVEDTVESVCSSLAASHLKHLVADDWSFPQDQGPALANALTSTKLVELSFNSGSCSPAFYDALGRGLAVHADSSLRKLHIMNRYQPNSVYKESLRSLLQHGANWQIHCLHLDLDEFARTADFEMVFSRFIASNKHLQRLVLYTGHRFDHGLQITKSPVSEAFSAGSGSLDVLQIVYRVNMPIDASWALTLKKLVASNLNRHRRLSGALFQRACQSKRSAHRQHNL